MANTSNINIELSNGQRLDYESAESLGIKFNRIVDDFQNPSKRFGEFSYTFNLPRTKNNDQVFEFPDVKGRTRIFIGKSFECRVYNNNILLLEGLIELTGIDLETYSCQFYSKFTQLVDSIGDKFISQLYISNPFSLTGSTNKEEYIINHINANYNNCDEADFQFPFVFYRTVYAPASLVTSQTSKSFMVNNNAVRNISQLQTEVFNAPSSYNRNWIYTHQLPPAFYLVTILKSIFNDIGWNVAGTWINNESVKKIIIPYNGDVIPINLIEFDFNKYLPKIKNIDFLKSILNVFNLYFIIDFNTKTFTLETYDTLFKANSNPYNITKNVDYNTISKNDLVDYEPQILFKTTDNNLEFALKNYGLTKYIQDAVSDINILKSPVYSLGGATTLNKSPFSSVPSDTYFLDSREKFNNKTSGKKKIQLIFSEPVMNAMEILTNTNRVGTTYSGGTANIYISVPAVTKQTVSNNQSYTFSPETGSTFLENNSSSMQYAGNMTMYYYYGQVKYDVTNRNFGGDLLDLWSGDMDDWCYINIATGGTITVPTGIRVKLPVASPYKLVNHNERDFLFQEILKNISQPVWDSPYSIFPEIYYTVRGMEYHALMMSYLLAGKDSADDYETTDCHLTFCDDEDLLFPTLYTKYHKSKYDTVKNGYLFKAKMRMNENDWREMQINRTIQYNDELFRIVSIKNYDPILRVADIELMKKS